MSNDRKFQFYWKAGLLGGLAGGLVFGVIMAVMGMLPGIASMVGSQSAVVGFAVHMMISLIFGLGFSVFAGIFKFNPIASGAVYGILLWIIFPVIVMPIMMGGAACGDVGGTCGYVDTSACGNVGGTCGDVGASACGNVGGTCGDVGASACGKVGGACGGQGDFDWISLLNHIIYGAVAGAVFGRVRVKSSAVY